MFAKPWRYVAVAGTVLVLAAATFAVVLSSRHPAPAVRPAAMDQRQAVALADRYRHDTVAHLPGQPRYAAAGSSATPCPRNSLYSLAFRYELVFAAGAPPANLLSALRAYWKSSRYKVIDATFQQLLAEDPATGFRVGVLDRAGRRFQLTVSSSCLRLTSKPLPALYINDLVGRRSLYESYVAGQLTVLSGQTSRLRGAIASGATDRARAYWLSAQLTWEHVGAAYGSFAELGDAIDGLPNGLPGGVRDPAFTGLHRLEYGLWHDEARGSLLAVTDRLVRDVAALRTALPRITVDPTDLPIRAHEILEDALRDHLTGLTDLGSGAGLAETAADVDATVEVLTNLAPLISARQPGLLEAIGARLATLRSALRTGDRTAIDAAIGAALENLAQVPGLLEVSTS